MRAAASNKEELRLPFFANATRVYNSYIDFLVQQGKTAEALKTADESRALTLAEGLGIEGKKCLASETAFNPQHTARDAKATILFYWLGTEHSYLWAVTPDRLKLYPLPPAAEIDSAVQGVSPRFNRIARRSGNRRRERRKALPNSRGPGGGVLRSDPQRMASESSSSPMAA